MYFVFKDNEDLFFDVIIAITIATVLGFIFWAYIQSKKEKKVRAEILNEITPRNGIITDILIHNHLTSGLDSTHKVNYEFYPIVKDIINDKIYVSFDQYNHSTYQKITSNAFITSKIEYKLFDENYDEINIGDSVKIYIKREIKQLQNNNGIINIDDKEYKYCGKITDSRLIDQYGYGNNQLFNETADNFLEEVNNITLFEWLLDFDTIGQKKTSKNWKKTMRVIEILSILIFGVGVFAFFIFLFHMM